MQPELPVKSQPSNGSSRWSYRFSTLYVAIAISCDWSAGFGGLFRDGSAPGVKTALSTWTPYFSNE